MEPLTQRQKYHFDPKCHPPALAWGKCKANTPTFDEVKRQTNTPTCPPDSPSLLTTSLPLSQLKFATIAMSSLSRRSHHDMMRNIVSMRPDGRARSERPPSSPSCCMWWWTFWLQPRLMRRFYHNSSKQINREYEPKEKITKVRL